MNTTEEKAKPPGMSEHRLIGQGAILLAAILWSTAGLSIKFIPWHPIVIAGGRSIIAAVFIIVSRFIVPPPRGVKNKPFSLWAAAIAYSLAMLSFVMANKLTSSANAILLQYSAPVWAALMGWWLIKEKPHWEHWGALIIVAGGLVLFFRGSLGSGALLGDGIAVFSGLSFGAYFVFMRMHKDGNPRDAALLAHIITGVFSIPFFFLYPPLLSTPAVCSIFYLGIIQLGVSSLVFAYGIKRVTAVQAMLTAITEPILNPVWVLIVTGERPVIESIAGGAVIIIAVVASSLIGLHRDNRKMQAKT